MAQQRPAHDLTGFPRTVLAAGRAWFREHGHLGPWYFAAGPGGRFNLDSPRGTLYLANRSDCAARERIGPDLADVGRVAASLVHDRYVSRLELPQDVVAAQLTNSHALTWGVVGNELVAIDDYSLTRVWAQAFDQAGFDGLWGRLRFSAGQGRGLSVFGAEGTRSWPLDPHVRTLRDVVEKDLRLRVVDPPHSSSLTVLDPAD